MKYLLSCINILSICAIGLLFASCSGNGNSGKTDKKDSVAINIKTLKKARTNTIFERHLTWAEKGYKGRVKTISSKHYVLEESKGKMEKQMDSRAESIFDANGYLLETNYYKPDGTTDFKLSHKFDTKGNDTESRFFASDGTVNGKTIAR
jgi:hypothetical protein